MPISYRPYKRENRKTQVNLFKEKLIGKVNFYGKRLKEEKPYHRIGNIIRESPVQIAVSRHHQARLKLLLAKYGKGLVRVWTRRRTIVGPGLASPLTSRFDRLITSAQKDSPRAVAEVSQHTGSLIKYLDRELRAGRPIPLELGEKAVYPPLTKKDAMEMLSRLRLVEHNPRAFVEMVREFDALQREEQKIGILFRISEKSRKK